MNSNINTDLLYCGADKFNIIAFEGGYNLVNKDDSKFKIDISPSQIKAVKRIMRNVIIADKKLSLEVVLYRLPNKKISITITDKNAKSTDIIIDNYRVFAIIGLRGKIKDFGHGLSIIR